MGVITGVSILTAAAPQATNNVLLALPSTKNVIPLFKKVKQNLSEILSAFEFIDRRAYDLAVKHGQGKALEDGDIKDAECFVLVETSGVRREHDEEVFTLITLSFLTELSTKTETESTPGRTHGGRGSSNNNGGHVTIPSPIHILAGIARGHNRSGLEGGQSIQVRYFNTSDCFQAGCRYNTGASLPERPHERRIRETCPGVWACWRRYGDNSLEISIRF